MDVRIYDATGLALESLDVPAATLTSKIVTPSDQSTVQDVIGASGVMPYSAFALWTPEIEQSVGNGEAEAISATGSLLGVNPDGRVYFPNAQPVLWKDFVQALDNGLFKGDPSRVVAYPFGVAGGWAADAIEEVVGYLFEHRDAVVEAWAVVQSVSGLVSLKDRITGRRRRQIAEDWRKHGITGAKILQLLERIDQWDPAVLANATGLSTAEALAALINAGYERSDDGLFRVSSSEDAAGRRSALNEIVADAQARGPGRRTPPPKRRE